MIVKNDMMGVLLDACPSFMPRWESFRDEWRQEADGAPPYPVLADFARHVIGMVERGEKSVLVEVFTAVERLCVEGDPYVREATVVGLLESLQNLNLHPNGTDPEQMLPYLGPASARWWRKLHQFWQHGELLTDDDGADPPARHNQWQG
jgi:hypothetical protein